MCSADIFLGLLAILFPPLPGTSWLAGVCPSSRPQAVYDDAYGLQARP